MKNRRGSTMILVGLSLIALVGVMALALDVGRMYLFRAQVHVAADAAALGGAQRLMRGDFVTAADTAVAVARLNLVERAVPSIATTDVIPGVWDFGTSTFTPAAGGSWSAAGNNAVQATATYTATYRFGTIFGLTTKVRSATSVAAVGYVGATECVRPWAVSYETLLRGIYPSSSPGNPYDPSYNLTAADVAAVSAYTIANQISLKYGPAGSTNSGEFGATLQPPTLTSAGVSQSPGSSSADVYRDLIGTACGAGGSPAGYIGPGDWLEQNSGNMEGPSKQGVANLCGINGNPQDFTCSPSNPCSPVPPANNCIKVAIYSTYGGTATANGVTKACNPGCFLVKYIGVFAVTGWDKDLQALGYFSALTTTGKFSSTPSELKKLALVR